MHFSQYTILFVVMKRKLISVNNWNQLHMYCVEKDQLNLKNLSVFGMQEE